MGRLHRARARRHQARRAGFEKENPQVKVKVVGGINDDKIIAASRGGKSPDVAQSFSADNAGAFCGSGAWLDLKPYMDRDGISDSIFPPAPRSYTQFDGTRCALPMLADAYGLYYNEDMLKKAGLTGRRRRSPSSIDYAKKLTVKNPDGSLKVVGFNPTMGWYSNTPANFGPMFGGKWTDDSGKSTLGTDPAWAKLLNWQKHLIDWYGYDNLVKFQAGLGDEFSASNAFEKGKLAMNVDGEWRTAFIADEAKDLPYGTAPVPVDDGNQALYGGGYTTGNIIGIPKRAAHPEQGWALLKYLATDDKAQVLLSNELRNVPTTESSAKSPDLKPDTKFETFLKIFGEPEHDDDADHGCRQRLQELFNSFVDKWQAGRVDDLQAGLTDLDKQIDAQLANAQGRTGAVSRTTRRRPRRRSKKAAWRRRRTVLAFMSPWIVGFGFFIGYPLVATVYLSFTHYDLLQPSRWIGFANYKYMFTQDKQIWPAVSNTLWLVAIMVPLKVMFAFGVALMLTRARRGVGVFRTIFYLPALAPTVAATLGFVYILNPATGPGERRAGAGRDRRAAVVQQPELVQAGADAAARCGASATR